MVHEGRRMGRGRRAAVALVAIAPWAGAAAGAGFASSTSPERAEALVLVGRAPATRSSPAVRAELTRTVVALARTPALAAGARDDALLLGFRDVEAREDIGHSVTATGDPAAGLVRIEVRAHSATLARALADSVAADATFAAGRIVVGADGSTRLVVGDFEEPPLDWRAAPPAGARGGIGVVPRGGRVHSAYLRVACTGNEGCGAQARVTYPFRRGVTYVARAWVRSARPGGAASAALGYAPPDTATGHPAPLTRRWTRLSVTWTPRRDSDAAAVGVSSGRASTLDLDGVLISTPGPATGDSAAFNAAGYVRWLPARATGAAGGARTLRGALLGGAAGLLAGLAGVAAAASARRNRK